MRGIVRLLPSVAVMLIAAVPTLPLAATAVWAEDKAPAPAGDKAAEIAKGRSLFISYGCGWCHEDGGRKAARCPQLMNDPHDDAFLLTRIATGSPGRMPAFGQSLQEPDIAVLITYIRSLKPD